MKISSTLLAVSLAANLGLLIVLLNSPAGRTANELSRDRVAGSKNTLSASLDRSADNRAAASPLNEQQAAPITLWESLRTDDLNTLAARLKSAGFTFHEIRAIVTAYGQKQIDDARSALTPSPAPYWRPLRPRSESTRSPEERAKAAELGQREYSLMLNFISSPEAIAHDEDAADNARERYGNLRLEKLQQLARIDTDYGLLRSKLFTDLIQGKERLTPEDRRQLALVETERRRDLRDSLTPEEYTEYSLHDSPTAQSLRDSLALLRLTESEYKALFALQRPIDENFDPYTSDAKSREAHETSIKNLAPQIEAALGPDRYAEYKHLSETGADQTTILMARLQLPLTTAGKITSLRDTATERAKTIRNDSALTPADRDAQLATLARETNTQLSTLLRTPRGLEAYSELKGDWLRALQSKPATP